MNTPLLLFAAMAVRNPFWPIGYEGKMEEITAEPKVDVQVSATSDADETTTAAAAAKVAAQAASAAEDSRKVSSRAWSEAKKTLKISGTMTITDPDGSTRHAIIINGFTYGDGDLISTNHNGHRFTWRVSGLTTEGALRLRRAKVRELDDEETAKALEKE